MNKISSVIASIIIILPNVILINMLIPVLFFNQNASAFAGGDGSASNPFQISNVTELQNMSANLSAHYVLVNDIDASATAIWNWNGTIYRGFIPIANDTDPGTAGFQGTNFTGSFDGRGYNITGLFINRTLDEYIGLFGRINANALIKNVNLINYTFFGDQYVGGLIGYNNGGTVTNCNTSGTINVPGDYYSDTHYLGGLIGYNLGPVTNCITKGDINNTGEYAGGLIGENDANVTNCTSYVNITGNIWGGGYNAGLIGYNIEGSITNCTAYGNIHGCYDIGGLLGDSWGPVKNCNAYGNVTGTLQFGGLIGMGGSVVSNCNTYGNVRSTGTTFEFALGGLIGSSSATVINCSTYGDIYGYQQVGGLLGLNDGIAINCTVYGNTMGRNDSWAVGGLVGENEGGTVINCIVYGNANSTDSDSWDTGGLIGYNENGKIENCISYANTSGYEEVGGLIGWSNGKVVNCTAFGKVNGTGDYTGGLIGLNVGSVTNCTAYGNITGFINNSGYKGSLIGENYLGSVLNCTAYGNTIGYYSIGGLIGKDIDGTVTDCVAYGHVKGGYEFGGLIGENFGTITNCKAYGNVTGNGIGFEWSVGGLIGVNDGTIINCAAYGNTSGYQMVGSLIGQNAGEIINCSSYGNTTGIWNYIGGLIGYNSWKVENCKGYGITTGDYFVGGLIGYNSGPVNNCLVFGNTIGDWYVGGLIGYTYGSVTNCTSNNNVSGNWYVGGAFGLNDGVVKQCSSDTITMGSGSDNYAIGGLIGWNDDNGIITECSSIGITTGLGNFSEVVGGLIGNNKGLVTNCNTFENTTGNNNVGGLIGNNSGMVTGCITYGNTTGNISIGGLIGNNSGTVSNCTSYGNTSGNYNVGGVVGYNNGTVTNCTSFGNVRGTGSDYIGGLIGINNGSIINAKAYGNVTGEIAIGGLIGLNLRGGTVTNCTTSGNVTGLSDVGGFIGNNSGYVFKCRSASNTTGTKDNIGGLVGTNNGGMVSNSCSHGLVTGNRNVGGLVGNNTKGTVTKCYSVGYIKGSINIGGLIGNNTGNITNCFWDNVTSGLTTSAGGAGAVGKNTTEMMKQVTFTSAGWDFMNIWGLDEGKTYPFFVFLYNPPFIVNEDVVYANEDGLYYVDYEAIISAHYPNNAIDKWLLNTNASAWLGMDEEGVLSGIPSNSHVGRYWVNVTVTDRYNGSDSHNFTLTVINVNDPPVIITMNIKSVIEDTFYNVDYNASDIDPTNDTLTWHLNTNATWLSINSTTGNLSGTPTNNNVGSYYVNITVNDNRGGLDFTNFTLTVFNTNDPPIISTNDVVTANEDILYSVDYDAIDIDLPSNILTWTLRTDAIWLGIDSSSGMLSGTPSNEDVGSYFVNVSVTDNHGGSDFTNFTLTVLNINDAPDITTVNIMTAIEDSLYWVDYDAVDIDPTMDTFTWQLNTDANWLSINSISGNLSGIPTNDDVGIYSVNITVNDGNGGTDSTEFSLTVYNINDEPVITTTQVPNHATEDVLFSFDLEAVDIDPTNDILSWHINTNADWLFIDSITGEIYGTPRNEDVGLYSGNVTVDDGAGGDDIIYFTMEVNNVNDPPTITTQNILTANEDELYSVGYEAIDIDPTEDTLTWTLKTNAEWLEISSNTGILSGIPDNDDVGVYWVSVSVDDGNGGINWSNFTLTVTNVNDAPLIITDDVRTANVNELYSVDYNASDIDPTNDILTWSLATNTSNWLTIDPNSGILSGTPSTDDSGIFWINITVSDGNGGYDWHYFILTIKYVPFHNLAPVISTKDIILAYVGELYSVAYQATDDRTLINDLKWSMKSNATWLNFNPSNQVLSGTPIETDIGFYWVNISVDDGEGGITFSNFVLEVIKIKPDNNRPKLFNGKMTPESGDTNTEFTFSVTYKDADNDPGNVYVWIDGVKHKMTQDLQDTDFIDGVEYIYNTKLAKGIHTYYFTADDGTDTAEPGDADTPTTPADAKNTPKITEPVEKESGLEAWIVIITVVFIIIILMIISFSTYKKKRRPNDLTSEVESRLEHGHQLDKGSPPIEFPIPEHIESYSNELINKLKEESFIPEEPSGYKLSEQEILNRFEMKFKNGEISKTTYDAIKESLTELKP